MSKLTDNNRLTVLYPKISKEWLHEKNNGLKPCDFSYGSERVVWWKCNECGNEWQAPIYYRTTKSSGVCIKCVSFAVKNPELLEEWDYRKNSDIDPYRIRPASSIKVWWKCKICCHEWKTNIYGRAGCRKNGCPRCKRKRANENNSLGNLNPYLSKEWCYEKNDGLTPYDFTANSHKSVWWRCSICGHQWKNTINQRNNVGNSCVKCKSVGMKNPELAKEWHPTKNIKSPYEVTESSGVNIWWKCLICNCEWITTPKKRKNGIYSCPSCTKVILNDGAVCDSIPEAYIYLKYKKDSVRFHHNKIYGKYMGKRRYDFYLIDQNKYVEVTSFTKNSIGISWISYLRNIVSKKNYVERYLKAKFEFIQFIPSFSQINYVRKNLKNH